MGPSRAQARTQGQNVCLGPWDPLLALGQGARVHLALGPGLGLILGPRGMGPWAWGPQSKLVPICWNLVPILEAISVEIRNLKLRAVPIEMGEGFPSGVKFSPVAILRFRRSVLAIYP